MGLVRYTVRDVFFRGNAKAKCLSSVESTGERTCERDLCLSVPASVGIDPGTDERIDFSRYGDVSSKILPGDDYTRAMYKNRTWRVSLGKAFAIFKQELGWPARYEENGTGCSRGVPKRSHDSSHSCDEFSCMNLEYAAAIVQSAATQRVKRRSIAALVLPVDLELTVIVALASAAGKSHP